MRALLGAAPAEPRPSRRVIRVLATEAPSEAEVRSLEEMGYRAVHVADVGWTGPRAAFRDHWFERGPVAPAPRPLRGRER